MVCGCICQICTCGKHQCPVHGTTSLAIVGGGEACSVTEYSNRFKAHELCKTESCKPELCIPEQLEFCAQTTSRTDYKHYGDAKREAFKFEDTLKPMGKLDSTSIYKKEFPAKEICMTKSCKPEACYTAPEECLQADTTTRVDYKAWRGERRRLCKKEEVYQPSECKLSSATTNNTAYKAPEMCRVRSCKPCQVPAESGCFTSMTENKAAFVAHQQCKPDSCKPLETYTPGPCLDALTINRKDYTAKEMCRTVSCKPEEKCVVSEECVSGSTETRDNYKAFCGERPEKIVPEDNLITRGQMSNLTTTKKDYVSKEICKTVSCKPLEVCHLENVPFCGDTVSRTDYKSWDQARRMSCAPKQVYQPPEVCFNSSTENKANFVQHEMCKTKSCKPSVCVQEAACFKGDTEYKKSYAYIQRERCPVLDLANLGYEFVQQTCDGHQVFTKFCPDMGCPKQAEHNADFVNKPL